MTLKELINDKDGVYVPVKKSVWQGRIDSREDFDAYRWHQWVELIDLNKSENFEFNGELGFAFVGFCCDIGVKKNKGRTGAAAGPDSIRKEMANLPCRFTEKLRLFDVGNIDCSNIDLETGQELLRKVVSKVLKMNLIPIVLGGGHEVAFGHYNGLIDYYKKSCNNPKLGIINFDAHFDLRPYPNGGTSGTMFRQIADRCASEGRTYSYMALGIQTHRNTVDLFKTADKLNVRYLTAKEIVDGDVWSFMEKVDWFIKEQDYLYLTVCSDVFSSAFAPGVSATQPLGLTPETVLKMLKYILKTGKVVSFDIAEVSPRFDQDNTTSNLASVIIFNVIESFAQLAKQSL